MFVFEISPSHFNIQNQRFSQLDDDTELPVKPVINDQDQQDRDDGFDDPYLFREGSTPNLDYDQVVSKNFKNERIKELEKIYLPRL